MNKFIMDVDGTLTPSRGIIDPQFKAFFNSFALMHDVYLVTGSDKAKTVEQLSQPTLNLCKRVYNCSGNDVYEQGVRTKVSLWVLPEDAEAWLNQQLEESPYPIRTGLHIENRPGTVNFSVVGRNADTTQRKNYFAYDNEAGERDQIAKAFMEAFPGLVATVGGETGIDIYPSGADKGQIFDDFEEGDTLIFFGDRCEPGGNDYPLARLCDKVHHVDSWRSTWKVLREQYA